MVTNCIACHSPTNSGEEAEFWSKAIAVEDEEWLESQASLIGAKRFKIFKSGKFIMPLEDNSRYYLLF